ncbi:MAG: CAP domain-containing protein [Terracidiphilus sp.]
MKILQPALVLFLAGFTSVAGAQTNRLNSGAIQSESWQLVQLANQARAQAGAGPLAWDAALAEAARRHCLLMVAAGQLSHQFADEPDLSARAQAAGARFSLIEENVALAPRPTAIHDAWMHSPHHHDNLLNPAVNRVGIAVVAGPQGLYAVADYERAVEQLTRSEVEATVARMVLASGVTVLPDPALARAACAMDDGIPRSSSSPQPRYVMRWQSSELTRLPKSLVESLATGHYHQAAVGNCPTEGQEGSFAAYRLAVLLY